MTPAHELERGDVHLRILNFTDLHMEIRAYDYFADAETPSGGLARAASFLEQLKKGAPNILVFDNGDFLQGNPMGDQAAEKLATSPCAPHPMIVALNTLKIDAATLGNHEFNYGLGILSAAIKQAKFPIVSANLLSPSQDADGWDTVVPPYTFLNRTVETVEGKPVKLKLGVLGLLPPQVWHWDRKHLEGNVQTRDIIETTEHFVPLMLASGADLIVVLCHSGIEMSMTHEGLENASLQVAAVDGVDAVISGHSHLVFPSPHFAELEDADITQGLIHGKPVTMAGFGASHIGRIDLGLSQTDGTWAVRSASAMSEAVPQIEVPQTETEREILRATERAHEETLAYIRRPVGETACKLDSAFAMLEPCSAVRFIATAQERYMRNVLRGTAFERTPLLSSAAPFKMGGRGGPENFTHVPAGRLEMRNLADIYGYPNVLRALHVDGAALRDWLEFSAGLFHQLRSGHPNQWLVDAAFPSYNFDTITGLTYEIDLSQPARFDTSGDLTHPDNRRIKSLSYQGRPVTPEMMFIVATNDYRASGSGTYPGADSCETVFATPVAHRDMLIRYVEETQSNRPLANPSWRFTSLPGTSALFNTTPFALAEQERMDRLGVTPLDTDATGFLTCRVVL